MNFKSRFIIKLSVISILIWGCSKNSDNRSSGNESEVRPPTVEAVQVITGGLPLEEHITGIVKARNQMDIYPEISAPIVSINANNADYIEEGEVLVRLRDTEARERLRQAESGYAIASARARQAEADLNHKLSTLERMEQLRMRNLESEAEVENIRAEVESAKASLELSMAQLQQAESIIEERKNAVENTIVRAPVSGLVGLRNAEIGQQANPSTRLFQIGDPSQMRIEVTLTEAMTHYITPGQRAVITPSRADHSVDGTITRISPFLNPVTHTTTAEIEVSNPENVLRPGMFVTVTVYYGESEQAILVPNNALYHHPGFGQQGVFVAERVDQELMFNEEAPPDELIGPMPVRFVPVNIVAKGRMVSGIEGISNNSWVVTLGQNLLARGNDHANVRPVEWDHILNLQEIQSRDLFEIIRNKIQDQPLNTSTGV
ncbi:MAG: efflux RND transporter periplasmic adaptor subunit [Balneolales bacterium]